MESPALPRRNTGTVSLPDVGPPVAGSPLLPPSEVDEQDWNVLKDIKQYLVLYPASRSHCEVTLSLLIMTQPTIPSEPPPEYPMKCHTTRMPAQ